ncbi:hypothetical protein L3Q82_020152 [Scortum barcoo]|uniref:Uncharacterized protein n=1 Tax=Scortum barcoo TaxID=214431 RepID=A0ACB8VBD6_9TELE|nr:hypothetical protein L3Q82_020152 [Scortum barcoo]
MSPVEDIGLQLLPPPPFTAFLYWWVPGVMATAGRDSYKDTKQPAAAAQRLFVKDVNRHLKEATNVCYGASVSQGDATEKLAHQVAAQVTAADCRVEEASGDPHEEEKDEAHKSSKGHKNLQFFDHQHFTSLLSLCLIGFSCSLKISTFPLPEPAAGCPTSPESITERIYSLDMEDKEKEDLRVGSLSQQRTKLQESQNSVKPEDEPQRPRPPD